MKSWLTSELSKKVRDVFERKYKRRLTDDEVTEIAVNLTDVIEEILKLKWKQKYGNARI